MELNNTYQFHLFANLARRAKPQEALLVSIHQIEVLIRNAVPK